MSFRFVTLCLFLVSACAAPLVQDAGRVGPSVLEQIEDARDVTVAADDGVLIRGVFVDAGGDAPVVLHLLPSGASVETGVPAGIGRIGLATTIEALRGVGWSSLVLDHRGVGRSDGRRGTEHLLEDGRVMWREAVRRAGEVERRVVVRAGSLGTLIVADLLAAEPAADRAHPGGVVLFAPVRASTIVRNSVRANRSGLSAWWASTFYSKPAAPLLEDAVRATEVPLLVLLPESDVYLPAEEAALVRDAAVQAGQEVVDLPGDHQTVILRAWGFEIDESSFSGRRVDELLPVEKRFLGRMDLVTGGPSPGRSPLKSRP